MSGPDDIVVASKTVEVAAAVLQRSDGSFLMAQRPADKIWAGYWEFPGGKIEPGETPYQALVRELHEELGILVKTAFPWITRVFAYPHATVRLHFFRVTEWKGALHPHEQQEFCWQSLPEVSVGPVLPANSPVLHALSLPVLYGISNAMELGDEEFLRRLVFALESGLRLVQLRETGYSDKAFRSLALRALPLVRDHGAQLILNRNIALAQELGADGVQLSSLQLAELNERPEVKLCGASCHNREELLLAESLACDFAILSPVLPTLSHPGDPGLGWDRFAAMATDTSMPVYALGGLRSDDLEVAWRHGAHGVALLRQAW